MKHLHKNSLRADMLGTSALCAAMASPGLCSAFDDANFDPQGAGTKGNMKIGTYTTTDTKATVEADGYFDSAFVSTAMSTDDLLVVSHSTGHNVYALTVSGTDVALSLLDGLGSTEASKGYVPLDITTLREIFTNDIANAAASTGVSSGGILAQDTAPKLERVNDATDKALRVNWASSNSTEVQFAPVALPPDCDTAKDVTVHLLAVMAGSTDTPTIDVQVFNGVGDTEMGGATAALSDTLAEVSVTIAAADIAALPTFLNIALVPGAHTTDALFLYGAWIEYTQTG